MLKRLRSKRPSSSLVISCLALFVALGGVGYAANGQSFILGQGNGATLQTGLSAPVSGGKSLQVTNNNTAAGSTALGLSVASGHAPFTVNSGFRVVNLNSDRLDGLDSASFLRKSVLQTSSVSVAGGVVDVMNTGTTNGVQGKTGSDTASGVYGENTSTGGFGIAGRAGAAGKAIYGDNTGGGYAGYFDDKVAVNGNLDLLGDLSCFGCVDANDISGRVNDSDKLDGINSTGFIQGAGKAAGQALAEGPGSHIFLGPPLGGFLRFSYACPSTLTDTGFLKVYNDSGSVANVFYESGGANPTYTQMAPVGNFVLPAAPAGDSFHIQAQGALGILTVEAATVHRSSDCHAQVQGLLTS